MTIVLDSACVRNALQEDCVKLHFLVSHPLLHALRQQIACVCMCVCVCQSVSVVSYLT